MVKLGLNPTYYQLPLHTIMLGQAGGANESLFGDKTVTMTLLKLLCFESRDLYVEQMWLNSKKSAGA
jgi:hypothetical protein